MNLYVNLLVIWLILVGVGWYLTTVEPIGGVPIATFGTIILIVGIIIAIIWVVKIVVQFIPNQT